MEKPIAEIIRTKVEDVPATDICFTIMPFGGWFDDYYELIYRPAIEDAGLKPQRADDLYRPSPIVNDIWGFTQSAKIILADLTGKNPNVFYELGLAHALAKPAVLVAETMGDVPFDLRALRILTFDKNRPGWDAKLRADITRSIKETIAEPQRSVPSTFLAVKVSAEGLPVTQQEKEILQLQQDLDLLRKEVREGFRSMCETDGILTVQMPSRGNPSRQVREDSAQHPGLRREGVAKRIGVDLADFEQGLREARARAAITKPPEQKG